MLLLLAATPFAFAQDAEDVGNLQAQPEVFQDVSGVPEIDISEPYAVQPQNQEPAPEYESYPPEDGAAYPPEQMQPAPTPAPQSSRPLAPGVRPPRPPAPPTRNVGAPSRPSAPPTPRSNVQGGPGHPLASEEKTGERPSEPVTFDFQDAPLYTVIESISRLTGRNFDLDPNLSAINVTIITHDKIPPEMAYEVLESILASRGYSMVESLDGHLIKILPTPDAVSSDKTPLLMDGKQLPKGYDGLSTHIVTIENGDAAEIQRVLQLLGSKSSQIDVYAPTNTLVITDTADGLRRMLTFLEQADVPGFDTNMEIFTLEYTRAEVISGQITQVLLGDGSSQGQVRPSPVAPQMPPSPVRPVRATRPSPLPQQTSQVIGSREEVLRMVPDERLNALIVVATFDMMNRVRDLVKRLDTPTPYESNNMHIYQLLNADAESVETAIQPLIGTAPRKQAGAGGGAPAAGGGGGGAAGSPEVQPFEQKVQITRYDRTNSLLIVASPQDYKLLEAFIARLDVAQRQVCVDAIIMEVTMKDDFGLKVDTAAISGNDGFAMSSTDNIVKLLTETAGVAEEIVGGPKAAIRSAALGLGTGERSGMTLGVYDDLSFNYKGREFKVPFAPVVLQAVENLTTTEVLSQPSLVTLDNEEANIIVGQEVPFITSTSSSRRADGSLDSGTYGGYTRVERQDVGIKLKVTPQISEGDNIMLSTEIEISDTAAKSITNVDITGPTTNKTKVTNKTLVKDGSTAVIAGLIKDSTQRTRGPQTPILGDLPVLNWFFSSRSNKRDKQNMVMLVTPHIIKEGMDIERLTNHKINEYYDANADELLKSGFFDRIFQKYDIRKNHRPTLQKSEALSGRRGSQPFRRGDIER